MTNDFTLPRCSRVFWSAKDARRRCTYTCRIIEVKPGSPKTPQVVLDDVRIVHDEMHPDYVPLKDLNIPGVNLFPKDRDTSADDSCDVIDLSHDSMDLDSSGMIVSPPIRSGSLTNQPICGHQNNQPMTASSSTRSFTYISPPPTYLTPTDGVGDGILSAHLSHLAHEKSLSQSWPMVTKTTEMQKREQKKKPRTPDLSLLSPKTLKLLNIKDPEKYKREPPVLTSTPAPVELPKVENKFGGALAQMAERLNSAAARSSTTKLREERSHSCSPSFSRGQRSRSNSEERFISPTHSRSSSVDRDTLISPPRFHSTDGGNKTIPKLVEIPEIGLESQKEAELDRPRSHSTGDLQNVDISTIEASETAEIGDTTMESVSSGGSNETIIVLPEDIGNFVYRFQATF